MSDQQNIDIVRQGYEAFGRGDLDGLLRLLADDVEWTTPGPEDLPSAGTCRGREQVGQFFAALDELYEFLDFQPQQFVGQGDTVVVMGVDTVRVKSTGNTVSEKWAHCFTVQDGRIVRFVEYMDTAAVIAELRSAHAKA